MSAEMFTRAAVAVAAEATFLVAAEWAHPARHRPEECVDADRDHRTFLASAEVAAARGRGELPPLAPLRHVSTAPPRRRHHGRVAYSFGCLPPEDRS